jgi:hypothetical protein
MALWKWLTTHRGTASFIIIVVGCLGLYLVERSLGVSHSGSMQALAMLVILHIVIFVQSSRGRTDNSDSMDG